jgi:hypothetical protein
MKLKNGTLTASIVEKRKLILIVKKLLFFSLELLHPSEGTLSCWSRLHLQSLAPTNPHWAPVVGYAPFFLCVIHKEDINLK